jgi:hypothetical protein
VKFALLIYGDEDDWASLDEAGRVRTYEEHAGVRRLAGGQRLGPGRRGARPQREGRDREGARRRVRVADGPVAETKEQLGGFYVIECPSREDAVEAARRLPADVVEVRPILEED